MKDEYDNEPDGTPSRMAIYLGSVALRLIEKINYLFITDEHLRGQ